MYKLFVIAKNNMKKQKGDMITFLILTFIAAFLIFDSLSAVFGLGKVLDDRFDKINGAHILLFVNDTEIGNKAAEEVFEENKHIVEYESTPMVSMSVSYKNKKDDEFGEFSFCVESFTEEKSLMKIEMPDKELKENDILIPLHLKANFDIGDTFVYKIEDDIYELNVAGYVEDPYFCSTINITIDYVYMSQKMIDKLLDEHPSTVEKYVVYKGRVDEKELEDGFETADLEKEIGDAYKEKLMKLVPTEDENNYTNYILLNWQMMRMGSEYVPFIVIAVILMFSFLIMIIAIVIISFSIKNFINKNMKSTGILEASGYTVKELRGALTIEICLVALVGSVIGIIVAMLTFKAFGDIISSVAGLSWNQPVNIGAALGTVIGLLLLIAIVSRAAGRLYKKVTVLDALRGGINTHNFKKNHFSFEKTPLPVAIVLSLKDTFGGIGRNIIMVFITAVLTISSLAGFGMMENFGDKPEDLLEIMGFEIATATMNEASGKYEEVKDALLTLDKVDSVLVYTGFEPTVYFNGKNNAVYSYAYDDFGNAKHTILLEGRLPKEDNEVLITSGVSEDMGIKTGDVIEIEYGGVKEEFIVVGINQRMERMGRTLIMTTEASKKLLPGTPVYQYNISAKDGVSYDDLEKDINKLAKERGYDIVLASDEKTMDSIISTLAMSMKLLCIIIVLITIFIVIFVESLVIRAKISREWRGMGISKALGQTSGGLILQIMLSNIPAILVGSLIGAMLAGAAGRGIVSAAFSLFVIKSVTFDISFRWIVITVIGIIAVAIATSALAGLRVRKLKPVEMITEE